MIKKLASHKFTLSAALVWAAGSLLVLAAQDSISRPLQNADSEEASKAAVPQVNTQRPSGIDWVKDMADSVHHLNFQISMVVHQPNLEAVPYIWRHALRDDGTTMEQLNILNGPGKEYIRINNTVSIFEPDVIPFSLTGRMIDGPIPRELLLNPLRLESGYDFIAVGRGRVSGRSAQQVRIVSRDNTRFSYQLWIDEESGIPLKLNMLDLEGQLIKQVQVTQLVITDAPDTYFDKVNHDALPPVTARTRSLYQHKWQLTFMPEGMQEIKRNTHRLPVTGQVVEYAMLSDGMVEVSVYVMPMGEVIQQNSVYRHETKTLLTRVDNDVQISIIGEIPPTTANKIALSLAARVQ